MGKIHAIPAGDDGEREKDRSQNRHQLHGFILFVIGLRLFKIPQGLAVINRLLRHLLETAGAVADELKQLQPFRVELISDVALQLSSHIVNLFIIIAQAG